MKKKTLCFDLDNVICNTKKSNYARSTPKKKVIKLINNLHDNGYIIKILTARYMGRSNDDIIKANKLGYKTTYKQLKKWGLKFDKLFLTKPSFDIYIDDKSLFYKKNWIKKFKKKFLFKKF